MSDPGGPVAAPSRSRRRRLSGLATGAGNSRRSGNPRRRGRRGRIRHQQLDVAPLGFRRSTGRHGGTRVRARSRRQCRPRGRALSLRAISQAGTDSRGRHRGAHQGVARRRARDLDCGRSCGPVDGERAGYRRGDRRRGCGRRRTGHGIQLRPARRRRRRHSGRRTLRGRQPRPDRNLAGRSESRAGRAGHAPRRSLPEREPRLHDHLESVARDWASAPTRATTAR